MPKTSARTVRPTVVSGSIAPPKSGTRPLVLGSMERVVEILGALQRGEPFTASTFARAFEVSRLTINRTLDMMRDRLGVPLVWDAARGSWVLTRPCATLPLLRIEPREAVALALAGRLFAQSHGPAFGAVLTNLLQKVAPLFGGDVSLAADAVDTIVTPSPADPARAREPFFPIFDAIRECAVLRFDYTKPSTIRPEARLVHPLHIAELRSGLILLAHDPARNATRHFALARMAKVRRTGATFTPPPGFDARAHLRGCMGGFAGDEEHEVRLALDARAAFYAREQPWHASQTLTERPDGRIELTIRVSHLADAKLAALRWADHIEVLSPPALRDAVRETLRSALARHEGT